ncbi:hypothetical protein M409DRAFT_16054 [Zasmidium cellare ATCC 36951]|uniref:ATPase inhibitor, mitochondrial n=1 Tax=Zasmidium cellare ATCC 36951 TaxID=1080233 RepID=A0A6A6D6D7_ZASCE|nr:uncharacterized protein M409DRAFT_16054 [Zasmidium cellare ATCC 36951]KAF2173782.1 hypothetical protein M409DRAFT_16054 [Zasmidium cellare ATCC 36951]
MPPILPKTLPTKALLPKPSLLPTTTRAFTNTPHSMAEGDTGSLRPRGEAAADSWTRREKAAEDMYIKQREKEIMKLLREKIEAQEKKLELDREVLRSMQDQYGLVMEGRE